MPAIFFGDAQTEESVLFQQLPNRRWNLFGTFRVLGVHGAADLYHRAIEEFDFLGGQLRIGLVEHGSKVRSSGEELAVEPHISRLQGGSFGGRHFRSHAGTAEGIEQEFEHLGPPEKKKLYRVPGPSTYR